jgi:hypothetical protein
MSFVQIGFLLAAAAVAIPIVIHLVFRQKAKRVELGTLRFLRVVLEQNARRRQVMRWLLLAVRIACIMAIAVLFARPYWLKFQSAGQKQMVVVLIDRSATMETKGDDGTRLVDQAIASVKGLLESSPANTRFEIAFFDHRIAPLVPPTEGGKADASVPPYELARLLKSPEVCSGGTDYGAAMEWARDVLTKAPPGPRQLHVFTDLQQSGLAWSEVDALPDDVISNVHDLGRAAVNNLAVTEARPERGWIRMNESTSIHVAVYNGGPFTTPQLPLRLSLRNGSEKVDLEQQVKIEPGAVESVRFDLPPLVEGKWTGKVMIEGDDDLPVDNQRHVAVLVSKPYQVLLVDGRSATSPILASTYYLEAAMRLAPEGEVSPASLFEPRRVTADEILPSLDRYQVVVLADVGNLDAVACKKVARFVESGGSLLVFGGENLTAEASRNLVAAGLGVGDVAGPHFAEGLPLRFEQWDTKHPVFAAFGDPQLGDLQRFAFSACTAIKPANDAKVLATFRGGRPAVIERAKGSGNVMWVATACDHRWGDWTRSRLYLPVMHQLLSYQTGLAAGGPVRQAILERDAQPATDEPPGIHEKKTHSLVVNMSPRESETERCSLDEFVNRFGLRLAESNPGSQPAAAQASVLGTELLESEFWPYAAVVLLGLLVVETLIANRTAA